MGKGSSILQASSDLCLMPTAAAASGVPLLPVRITELLLLWLLAHAAPAVLVSVLVACGACPASCGACRLQDHLEQHPNKEEPLPLSSPPFLLHVPPLNLLRTICCLL
jgi:hypothetical protein